MQTFIIPETKINEFDPRLKFEMWLTENCIQCLKQARRSIETGFWRICEAAQIH